MTWYQLLLDSGTSNSQESSGISCCPHPGSLGDHWILYPPPRMWKPGHRGNRGYVHALWLQEVKGKFPSINIVQTTQIKSTELFWITCFLKSSNITVNGDTSKIQLSVMKALQLLLCVTNHPKLRIINWYLIILLNSMARNLDRVMCFCTMTYHHGTRIIWNCL